MGVSLIKGGNVSLTKEAPGLNSVTVGLGWKPQIFTGSSIDLDASAILVGQDGKVVSQDDFVYYNRKSSTNGSVILSRWDLTNEGEGNDEQIHVSLSIVPPEVNKIVIAVSIYDADTRGQSLGQIRNAFIRVVNQANGTEIARYDLSEDASTDTAMVFGELYRHGVDWKFRAVGQTYASGLAGIASEYGVTI